MVGQRSDRALYHPAFTLRYFPTNKPTKIRIAVGNKLSKKATERNQFKRRVREIWRVLAIPPQFAITLYPKPVALTLTFAELKIALNKITAPLR